MSPVSSQLIEKPTGPERRMVGELRQQRQVGGARLGVPL